MDVTQSEDFLNLSVTQLGEWISSDDISVKGEEEVFQVIVKWMDKSDNREHHSFIELFRHVRLVYVSRNFVFNVMLSNPFVESSTTCTTFVLDAMKELSYGTEECYFAQPPRRCLKTHEDAIVACGEKKTFCYLPSANKWYKLADVTETFSGGDCFGSTGSTCHGRLFSTGMNAAGDCTVERYDPQVNSWATVKPFAGASICVKPAVASFQGLLYVVGGSIQFKETDRVHRYNPDTNLWQEVAPMSIARQGVCAVADRNYLYAIGGCSDKETLDLVEKFDPEKNCWERVAPTLEKKAHACGTVVRGKVFLFGGHISGKIFTYGKFIEMYDPATNVWTGIECVNSPQRYNFCSSAVNFKEKIFVICSSYTEDRRFLGPYLQ